MASFSNHSRELAEAGEADGLSFMLWARPGGGTRRYETPFSKRRYSMSRRLMDSMFGGLYIMPPSAGNRVCVFFPFPPVWQVHYRAWLCGRRKQSQRIQKDRCLLVDGAWFAKRMPERPFHENGSGWLHLLREFADDGYPNRGYPLRLKDALNQSTGPIA
jgi:hypothetical protein